MPRIAVIDRDGCLKAKCHQCIKVCPVNRMGEKCIVADEEGYPIIDENLCTGCGICPKRCPTKVIKVINLKEEAGELIHQYGVNEFRLYNLPIPREGVVGFVGENGIGKTTALSILAGKTIPNFGAHTSKPTLDDASMRFRGRELGNYFQKLKEGISISYKPQAVESLRSDVTVRVSLGISMEFEKVIEKLNIKSCLDKKMSELSGGELQMVAIASAIINKADLYYFDEPCSFLDVSQRLVAARAIQELKNVIVVEHDLAVLDYLTDYVHIFYGENGAYGVVSGSKSSRAGVNEYLDGFLDEENIRLRKEPITFEVRGLAEKIAGSLLLDYKPMKKTFDNFTMTSKEGKIYGGEIIGILGPNATGKTTFIKMLAGIERPDEEEFETKMKISYKPQYVKPEEGKVREVIERYSVDQETFADIRRHFHLQELMEKECSTLSGGELQRVAIAICLGQQADIYLIDEPSAFLDIEQRLSLASIIRKRISEGKVAFVVDHDIVFIDNISDRLVVFDGQPGISGAAGSPTSKREGMNAFLKRMNITLRRDPKTKRPRINKPDSVLDREQKEKGEYYYVSE